MTVGGQVALVTGSADGIGRAVAEALAQAGAQVAMVDISRERLERAGQSVRSAGTAAVPDPVISCVLDVANAQQVRAAVDDVAERTGGIDILVNCAGVISSHSLVELSEPEWDRIMDVNLKGMFLVTQAVLSKMMNRRHGRIVNIGSDLSSNGQRLLSHYCASKHGVIGFTRAVALEAAEYGILVNAVCPGPTDTKLHYQDVDMQVAHTGISREAHLKRELESIPLKKLGKPAEVARVVLFLVSDENTHITGEAVNVCGGLVMH